MKKEIPPSTEKSAKSGRLRDAARHLQETTLDRPLGEQEWNDVISELSQDELDQLKTMAGNRLARALAASRAGDEESALEEAAAAVLLWPQDPQWARQTASALRKSGLQGQETHAFLSALDRRSGRKSKNTIPRWLWILGVLLLALPLGLGTALLLWPGMRFGGPPKQVQGPRDLQTVFDTQGVKANIEVAQSRLLLFPESTVAELSAWVVFPEHRVDLWEGSVSVLDAQGQTLTKREVTFRAEKQGPLEPGQGTAIFQQFDAWPWFDKVASFQLSTTRILAQEANPVNRTEIPVNGVDALSAGYNLKVWLDGSAWTERFASRVHTLTLEIENTGLKPFAELEFSLVWIAPKGTTLKTLTFRPVSAFRTALPSGGRLGWQQETVFDTEVFPWTAGEEPHPVLELKRWQ